MQNVSFQNINSLWAFRNQNEFHNLTIFVQQLKVQQGSRSSAQIALHKSRLNVKIIRTKGKKSLRKVLESVEFVSKTQISLKDAIS